MKTHIITIFDKHHLGRAVCLRQSLNEHAPNAHVRFLCLDQISYDISKKMNLKETTVMKPEDLNDKELLDSRPSRTNPEFASTAKPAFLRFMLNSGIVGKEDLLVFVDPDFLFYNSPELIFEKAYKSGSIVITPHRFPKRRENEKNVKGTYNAGIVFFKNDESAKKCLEDWRLQCIDWCYLRFEDGKIGDQGYMNDWPKKYKGVYELWDKEVNLSNWNIENYKITKKDGNFFVDEKTLICYHFHGLKIYFNSSNSLKAYPITVYHTGIYEKYIEELGSAYKKIQEIESGWQFGSVPKLSLIRYIKQKIWRIFNLNKI